MNISFLDTSAFAKLYHEEIGCQFVSRPIFGNPSRSVISRLAEIEMGSVFAVKVRTGQITETTAGIARQRLHSDLASGLVRVVPILDAHFRSAERLLIKYGSLDALRTLDALQLAVALDLRQRGCALTFVATDQRLCRAANREGLLVINPEQPRLLTP